MPATSSVKLTDNVGSPKPKYHSYSVHMITLACNILNCSGVGSGTCVKLLDVIQRMFEDKGKTPCRSTVAIWNRKLLELKKDFSPARAEGKWVLLMDESITIGASKVLLLLGVNLDNYKFSGPLSFEDCHVLATCVARSWTSETIVEQIEKVKQRGFRFDYAVTDQGANLIKAANSMGLPRVNDCAHYFGTLLRREYLKAPVFVAFEQACTRMKRAGTNCNYAHLLPPKHHANSRFMNITPVIKWGMRIIGLLDCHSDNKLVKPYLDKISWVMEYRQLLEQMFHSVDLVDTVSGALKDEGYHEGMKKWSANMINQATMAAHSVRSGLLKYIKELEVLRAERKHLLCSTDIVESHFSYLKRKPIHCVADMASRMVLYNTKQTTDEVKQAMESCTVAELYRRRKHRRSLVSVAEKRRILNKLVT